MDFKEQEHQLYASTEMRQVLEFGSQPELQNILLFIF